MSNMIWVNVGLCAMVLVVTYQVKLLFYCRATSFAERLRLGLAVIHGEQKEPESERLDGRQSPPPALAESQKFAYTFTDHAMDLPGS